MTPREQRRAWVLTRVLKHELTMTEAAGMEGERNISNSDVVDASTTVITVKAAAARIVRRSTPSATGLTARNRRSSVSWITRGASPTEAPPRSLSRIASSRVRPAGDPSGGMGEPIGEWLRAAGR